MWFCIGNNSRVEELNVRQCSLLPPEDVLSILTDTASLTILKLLDEKVCSIPTNCF